MSEEYKKIVPDFYDEAKYLAYSSGKLFEIMEFCDYITLNVKMLCWSIESHKTVYRVPSKDFSVTSAYKALIDFGYNELVKKLIEIKKLKKQLSDSKDEFWKIHKKLERKLKK